MKSSPPIHSFCPGTMITWRFLTILINIIDTPKKGMTSHLVPASKVGGFFVACQIRYKCSGPTPKIKIKLVIRSQLASLLTCTVSFSQWNPLGAVLLCVQVHGSLALGDGQDVWINLYALHFVLNSWSIARREAATVAQIWPSMSLTASWAPTFPPG